MITLVAELHDSLLHDFYKHREIFQLYSRLSFGYQSSSRSGQLQVIKHEQEQCGPMKHKARSIMDLLKGIWVIGEVVRKFELQPMGDLTPEFGWEAMNKGMALLSSGDLVFCNQKCSDGNKLPMISF